MHWCTHWVNWGWAISDWAFLRWVIYHIPTENKAAYSHIILLIKKTCIMAIYYKKDSANTCKTLFTRVCKCKHWKNEKVQVVTPD